MQTFEQLIMKASDIVWGIPLLVLLCGTHLFLTFRLGFIQRHIFKAIKISFQRKQEGEGDISQFGALTTALAATIGTGNIVGVATAVAMGGPGAVLWMWVVAVMVGSVATLPTVWAFADIANGLMALPNLISLIVLNGIIVAETKKYLKSDLNEKGLSEIPCSTNE